MEGVLTTCVNPTMQSSRLVQTQLRPPQKGLTMKRYIVLLLSVLLLASCASYTIAEARENIVYPVAGGSETRIRVITEEKEKARAEEEAKKTNEYPEDLSSITLPFYYNPVRNTTYREEGTQEFNAIFIPLGEEELSEESLLSIKSLLESHNFALVGLSGSLLNQSRLVALMGKDAITLEGGTVILDKVVIEEIDSDYIKLGFTETRKVAVYNKDYHPIIPETGTEEETLLLVDKLEKLLSEPLIDSISTKDDNAKLLFLSSIAPSSLDWTSWTDYSYREERDFLISDLLIALNWNDTIALTRFSEETDSSWTREYGEYEERLDFIYSKNMIVTSSYIIPVENMETRSVVATFILP